MRSRIWLKFLVSVAMAGVFAAGCAIETAPPSRPPETAQRPSTTTLDPAQVDRLKRIMLPLVRATDNPRPLNQIKLGVIDDPQINAASAGGGEFYVTTGLLQKANDEHLAGVLAHEVAHDDLGHVAKAQARAAGLNIGVFILDQIIPGSSAVTPIAGTLIARSYSRQDELAADRHGVELLRRVGLPKEIMINTLTWLMRASGSGGGGFFSTHPASGDRIEALRRI